MSSVWPDVLLSVLISFAVVIFGLAVAFILSDWRKR